MLFEQVAIEYVVPGLLGCLVARLQERALPSAQTTCGVCAVRRRGA